MIQAVVLGSGTSNGVPMLGREYPEGYLDDPRNWRTRASLLLKGPTGNLLIDCAPELRLQMAREREYDVEAVLITHTHADHVMGMDDLRSLCLKYQRAMPVFTLPRYQDDIRRIYPYAFQEFPAGVWVPRFDLTDCPAVLKVGGMEIHTFVVDHGKTPVIGIRVGDFAYVTDVSHIPPEAEAMLQGLNTLILDAVRIEPHPNHFHLAAALAQVEKLRPRQTYLTHLSHDYDHAVTERELPESVKLAFDGLVLTVSDH
ncbi:MBL fold metallo-hydrolase [bacterium]|nr:MAG: MBL fold metallo-hydrolase [bacterium]